MSETHNKELEKLRRRVILLEETLRLINKVLARPAANHRFMQIAEPARRCLNIITGVLNDPI